MRKILLGVVAILSMTTASMAQSVPNYVPTNGLVGWWPFNGNANDESTNTNDGTVNGATLTTDRFGIANSAYSFDGNDYIFVANNSNLSFSSHTISFWYNRISPPTGVEILINKGRDINTGTFYFGQNGQNISSQGSVYGCNGSTGVAAYTSYNINTWTNIICSYDVSNSTMKIFENGVQKNSIIASNYNFTNTLPLLFGAHSWFYSSGIAPYYFNGKLDDIGIWNRALTDQEISNLYNANICYDHVTVTDTLIINDNLIGFNPVTYQNTIKVWPNPAHDHITIDNGNISNLNGYQIKITNVLGQQVFQSAINQQQFYIDLSTWTGNGAYYLNLINPQGVTIETKVIVVQ
jgi:hypothetical protein